MCQEKLIRWQTASIADVNADVCKITLSGKHKVRCVKNIVSISAVKSIQGSRQTRNRSLFLSPPVA